VELENRLTEFRDELFILWNEGFQQIRDERLQSQRNPTLMEIFGVEEEEFSHSHFISWLLDPKASHGIGEVFLRKFIEKAAKEKKMSTDGIHFKNVHIEREKGGEEGIPDIVLGNESFDCLIENKIKSGEGRSVDENGKVVYQTERYYKEYKNKFRTNKKFFVFLTKEGTHSKCQEFVHLSYCDIRDILNSLRINVSRPYDYVIDDYIQNLEVNILSEFRGFSKKAQLYYEYLRDIEHVREEFDRDIKNLFESIHKIFSDKYDTKIWYGESFKDSFWMAKRTWLTEEKEGVYYGVTIDLSKDKPIRIRLGAEPTEFRKDFNREFYNLPEIREFRDDKIKRITTGKEYDATLVREFFELKFDDERYDKVVFDELKNFENKFTSMIDKIIKKVRK
jgi:hypothetical protein